MMQSRLTLRLASEDDYLMAGVAKDILSANSPPGRGVMGGNEIQVAVYGGDDNVAVQARAIGALAGRMSNRGSSHLIRGLAR